VGFDYCLRRLKIAKATTPSIMPATMDSHGKPGIAGSAMGVETELVDCVVVVGVFWIVTVDTEVLAAVVEVLSLEVLSVLEVLSLLAVVDDVV
jgi:hypothetical protein